MELKLYNTLTRRKEVFTPLDPNNVRMYVCGPTVYDYAHIGNARPVIVFDVLFRLLRHIYGEKHVTYVRNITDIDDKIIARAHELQGDRNSLPSGSVPGVPIAEVMRELTERTYGQYHEDVAALGCLPPTYEPRATEYVPQMIAMIAQLIAAGHAYVADGHVLYDVSSKRDYGKLANRSVDDMIAGARVDVAPYKKGPMDFVLWKPSDAGAPGWDSPWGRGRPGWHIECSAMSEALLGETFDIHGGGIDLVFPHHENEIAQSEGAHEDVHGHSKPLAKVWMHNGFLQVEGEKMSKSLGNFVTINDLLGTDRFGERSWPGSVLRLAMLMTNYRQPIDWTVERLTEAYSKIAMWHASTSSLSVSSALAPEVTSALANDLNTHEAITALDALYKAGFGDSAKKQLLRNALRFLGIEPEGEVFDKWTILLKQQAGSGIEAKIEARNAARKAKDFKEADRIRAELDAMGIQLKDSKDPKTGEIVTTWELKR
jgi:cysteinyl-tRNA synthetase